MVYLVTVEQAKAALDVPGLVGDVTDFLSEAILQAQRWAEAYLACEFQKRTHVDYISVEPAVIQRMTVAGSYPVKLTTGFINSEAVVESSATLDGTFEVFTGWKIDNQKGILFVPSAQAGRVLKVTYLAGWDEDDSDEAPEELSLGIKAYLPVTRAYSNYAKDISQGKLEVVRKHAEATVSTLQRLAGTALRPFLHEYG